jgi:(p)ppGpp synthase/HD superfamily hydrolase
MPTCKDTDLPAAAPPQVAQTNLQLYAQLLQQQWSADDMLLVQSAYEQAARRFAGLLRASGKCFIAHLVGTASITAHAGGSVLATRVALLHAWRTHGLRLFGRRVPRIKGRFPADMEPALASGIRRYELFHQRYRRQVPSSAEVAGMQGADREALLVHLANELEEFVDFGMLYRRSHRTTGAYSEDLARLARDLGHAELAALIPSGLPAPGADAALQRMRSSRSGSYR